MNPEPDIVVVTKPVRTPKADDNRTKKKVRTGAVGDLEAPMDTEQNVHQSEGAEGRSQVQKQLFPDQETNVEGLATSEGLSAATGVAEEERPLPHSSKQAEPPMTFKEKLMGGTQTTPTPDESTVDDLVIEEEDFSVVMEGLIPTINFSDRVKNILVEDMRYAVVVKLLGRFTRQETLRVKIESLWKPTLGFKLTELEGGCYLVRLNGEADYQKALLGGPWVVLGHYLTVHPWDPNLSPLHLEIKQVYGWVRLPGLPFHYYRNNVLRTIGNTVGEVLKIDYNTEGGLKARFARIAVKIDLRKPLISRLKIDGITQFVEYEGLPTICYHCGCYGHLEVICPTRTQPNEGPSRTTANPAVAARSSAPVETAASGSLPRDLGERETKMFGEWMKAPGRIWKNSKNLQKDQPPSATQSGKGGSRYEVLAMSEEEGMKQKESQPERDSNLVFQSVQQASVSANHTRKAGPKTVGSKNKKNDKVTTYRPKNKDKPNPETIYQSSAYEIFKAHTSLDQAHHTVVTTVDPQETTQAQNQPSLNAHDLTQPNPRPNPALGKDNIPPQPLHRSPPRGGFKIQSPLKIHNIPTTSKEECGGSSEELVHMVTEELGNSPMSDEDSPFVEATAVELEEEMFLNHSGDGVASS